MKMRMQLNAVAEVKGNFLVFCFIFSFFFFKLSFLDRCLATAQCLKILGLYTENPQKQRESF